MAEKLISGDNHIDLTYLPPDLWSSEAPNKWKQLAPRVEEKDDGLHWFVDDQDRGMWNGIGPGFLPYQKGMFSHIDEMKDLGFEWNSRPGAKPRPTTPELRLADLDRDGLSRRNHLWLPDDQRSDRRSAVARLVGQDLQRLGRRFRQAQRPEPRLSARHRPQHRPDRGRCRGPALRQDGAARRRSRLQAHDPAALHPRVVPPVGGGGGMPVPDLVPLDRASRRCAPPIRRRWRRSISRSGGWCARPCSSSTRWRCWSRYWPRVLARNTPTSTLCSASRG